MFKLIGYGLEMLSTNVWVLISILNVIYNTKRKYSTF